METILEGSLNILYYIIGCVPVIAWIMTIKDIYKSDFENDNKWKTVWFWSVILTGYIAMMFYYWFGVKQKVREFRFLKQANIYKY